MIWEMRSEEHTSELQSLPTRRSSDLGKVAVGFRDDDADGGLTAGQVFLLAEDVNDRPADDLGDGFDAINCREFRAVVLEAVAKAMPEDVFERDRVLGSDCLLPGAAAFADFDGALDTAHRFVLGIENLHRQPARSLLR